MEVIRSLNPNVVMVSTHGFEHQPEKPMDGRRSPAPETRRQAYLVVIDFTATEERSILDGLLPEYRFCRIRAPGSLRLQPRRFPVFSTSSMMASESFSSTAVVCTTALRSTIAGLPCKSIGCSITSKTRGNGCCTAGLSCYSHFTGVRNSWTKLIEDLGFQYEFVGRGHIEQGKLGTGQYRVLIMPQSLAVSARLWRSANLFIREGC